MLRNKIQSMLTSGLLGAALLFVPVLVQAADVSDGGGFFSAGAIAKANEAIRALEKKSGHDVRIETFATVPEGKAQAVSKMDAKERETFFSNWLHDRAEATKSRGVVILICKEPSHLRLWAGKPLERAGFGAAQAKPITAALLAGFKAKEYDKALSDTVTQLTTTLEGLHAVRSSATAPANSSHPAPHKTPQPAHHDRPVAQQTGYGGLIFVMAIVIGGIVVISLLSRLFGGRQSGAGYGGGYGGGGGGGGGGFMQGLAGGIFGAVAGNWLYNQFSGGHAHGSDSNWTGSDSSSGGASNDSSSNSDSGFSGGTDFGGGDFGGGGGGGGGGDAGGGDF